jgi:hypothetical protein
MNVEILLTDIGLTEFYIFNEFQTPHQRFDEILSMNVEILLTDIYLTEFYIFIERVHLLFEIFF